MNDDQYKVLSVLASIYHHDANCSYFRFIEEETGMDRKKVRRICRLLARKGLAAYESGLFDDEGRVAGSGYCCTRPGLDAAEKWRGAKAA